MSNFKKERHIKSSGPGGAYNGPTLKSIMTNCNGKLDDIKNIVLENGSGGEMRFVTHLVNLNALNSAVNTKVLDLQKVKETIAIDELRENFFHVYKQNLTCLKL